MRRAVLVFAIALCWAQKTVAQDDDEERAFQVRGLLFGDLYHVAGHHTEEGEGATGAVLRRGYLTFDADFSERWYGRARVELNQSGELETYTFDLDFKDLYLGWKLGRHHILVGLSPTPAFDVIESIWDLRYLARTPLDLQGVASRDTGVALRGPLDSGGSLSYRAMVGTGLDFGAEVGDGPKWMGALSWEPSGKWSIDLYSDYERLPGPADRRTVQVFAGYRTDQLRWGLQYTSQYRERKPRLELASAFLVREMGKTTSLIGRIDRILEPSPSGANISYLPYDPASRATTFFGGVELRLTALMRLTPNAVVTAYDRNDQGIVPATDVHLRLTLFVDLE